MCLTVGAEIGVVADGTLVAHARNVGAPRVVAAEMTIAQNTKVDIRALGRMANRLINRHQSMSSVVLRSLLDAVGAVVKVGAVKALVANADDILNDVRKGMQTMGRRRSIPCHSHHKWRGEPDVLPGDNKPTREALCSPT